MNGFGGSPDVLPMRRNIKLTELLELARDLRSEDCENPEYDRALIELCCDAAGWSMDEKPEMAKLLGVKNPKL